MSKASAQAVDAYKTYLYRKGNKTVKDIESVKAGQPIDLTELDKDIGIVLKTIAMCDKSKLPTYEEQAKLKGLVNLRNALQGRNWPSVQDIQEEAKKIVSAAAELETKKAAIAAAAKAALFQQQQDNKFKAPDHVSVVDDYYNKKFLPFKSPILLPQSKAAVQLGVQLGRQKIEQEWIMRVGMISNCNVSILQSNGGLGSDTALRCKVCSLSKYFDVSLIVSTSVLAESIERFCKDHRHEAPIVDARPGRLFRDEE